MCVWEPACSGQYNAVANTLASFLCKSPVNGGTLRVSGSATLGAQPPAYDLTFAAEKIPLAATVRLLHQLKKQIPSDLTASGSLSAEFHALRNTPEASGAAGVLVHSARGRSGTVPRLSTAPHSTETQWTGSGAATNVRLSSNGGADEFALGTIPLALTSRSVLAQSKDAEPPGTHLRIGPVALTINDSAPVSAGGWISSAGYLFSLRGDAELRDLFRLERTLGLPVARPAAEGSAKLDVSIYGPWQGFALPSTSGTAQLRNVHAEMHGLNTPIEIASAAISLTPDLVAMQKISARVGNTHWSGASYRASSLRRCRSNFERNSTSARDRGSRRGSQLCFPVRSRGRSALGRGPRRMANTASRKAAMVSPPESRGFLFRFRRQVGYFAPPRDSSTRHSARWPARIEEGCSPLRLRPKSKSIVARSR